MKILLTALALAAGQLHAETAKMVPADEGPRYVLGLGVGHGAESPGARRHETSLSPMLALRWGRWRISNGGASSLLGFGSEVYGPGASTELFRGERARLGLSLRIDSGRSSKDADSTRGLPDVRRTLRGRMFASYALTSDWQLSSALSQDLLGHDGGLTGDVDLNWRLRESRRSELTFGIGLSAASARHMRSYFGVRPEGSAASGLRPYEPGSGLRDVHLGVGYRRSIHHHWIVFASIGGSRLLGPAADSPMSVKPSSANFGIGLAYRN
jgi:MipA family protein